MEGDFSEGNNGSVSRTENNGLHLYPVSVGDFGQGLPYAPVDFPKPGDNWSWRTGRRIAKTGYFLDRYIYLPTCLQESGRKKGGFASRLSVEQYVRKTFPNADINAFFASFSWKIPSVNLFEAKGIGEDIKIVPVPSGEIAELSEFGSDNGMACCNAGNKICPSLVEGSLRVNQMSCDICCSEPGFCRNCCCILCCEVVDLAYGGYSSISCEAPADGGLICGHLAHLECGLRSYMAGTVGGTIALDAEYHCRRCDSRTNLIPHVEKLIGTCESIEATNDIEKILNFGICILRGSQKTRAKWLLHHIELAMTKLKNGTCLEDVWKMDDLSAVSAGRDGLRWNNPKNGSLDHGADSIPPR